jgi:hypothetical protein
MDKAQRLEMIKAAAKRLEFKKKQAANAAKVRRWTDVEEKPRRTAAAKKFDAEMAKLDENHNCWTDGPQYAKQHYGDVYRDTTRFDNDWD